jgi:glutathione S-transferase
MPSTFRLLGRRPSINVRKVLWTLDEIGCDYRFEACEQEMSASRGAEIHALNPNDQFPILIEDSGPLWESNTICRYLVSGTGRHDLLPVGPRARADVECWMDWQATDLNDAWRYAFLALQRRKPGYADPSLIEASINAWNGKITILDAQLRKTGAFVTGSRFTLADIGLGLSVHRWFGTAMKRPTLPNVEIYYERLKARPAFPMHASDELV